MTTVAVFIILAAIAGTIHYITYKMSLAINLGHVFFISFIINSANGMSGEVLFIFLAGILPEILSGYVDQKTLLNYPLMIAVIFLFGNIFSLPLVLSGLLASFLYYAILYMISTFSAEAIHEKTLEVILPFFLNILYFTSLSGIIEKLL